MSEEQGAVETPEVEEDNTPWYGEIEDTSLGEWAQNKGFKTPADAFKSYRKLEQFMGADKAGRGVVIPKENSDPSEWESFYTSIGRPANPTEYDLSGEDGDFKTQMSQLMFDSGIPKASAQKLADAWNQYVAGQEKLAEEQAETDYYNQEATLRKEWGGAFDRMVEECKTNYRQFGITDEQIDGLQKVLGFDGAMKFVHGIGQKVGEDSYIDGGLNVNAATDAMTPARAAQEMEKFNADPENFRLLSQNDAKTVAKRKNILKYL